MKYREKLSKLILIVQLFQRSIAQDEYTLQAENSRGLTENLFLKSMYKFHNVNALCFILYIF